MNHRELVLSARKKARFVFLALPEDLQDELIEGLDSRKLTLYEASDLIAKSGHGLSHEAIAGYYRAVRTERRLMEVKLELGRIIAEFAKKPQKEALEGLVNLVIATAASGVADGTVGIKDINLAKLVEAMGKAGSRSSVVEKREAGSGKEAAAPAAGADHGAKIVDPETLKTVREQIYGIV